MRIQLSDHFTTGKLLRFVAPSIVMMIFTSVYGVVDGLFVYAPSIHKISLYGKPHRLISTVH